ncbi:hypothetical protein Pan161_06030 [Gimesia algae]|uniref:Uncharacterized protein n=1 Tax=Gimesia algae TaxID=2527971 RepID=A0A517V7J2_9PLAN|nr:hypothetical protein Pan161_06030 [Gimesia algae]
MSHRIDVDRKKQFAGVSSLTVRLKHENYHYFQTYVVIWYYFPFCKD